MPDTIHRCRVRHLPSSRVRVSDNRIGSDSTRLSPVFLSNAIPKMTVAELLRCVRMDPHDAFFLSFVSNIAHFGQW